MKRLNFSLPRKKLFLYGIPLVCGVIIGTTIAFSIPHAKADTTQMVNNSTPVPVVATGNNSTSGIQTQTDPPTQTPTSAPIVQSSPTAIPADPAQPQPTTAPCK